MAGELLSNRVALVTGSTGGIGRAAAIGLAAAGAQVAIAGRRRDAGETTVDPHQCRAASIGEPLIVLGYVRRAWITSKSSGARDEARSHGDRGERKAISGFRSVDQQMRRRLHVDFRQLQRSLAPRPAPPTHR
jgi:NAD(P)-dependent dehydrogenase (short-subunit alcohol dehydrogenase family)